MDTLQQRRLCPGQLLCSSAEPSRMRPWQLSAVQLLRAVRKHSLLGDACPKRIATRCNVCVLRRRAGASRASRRLRVSSDYLLWRNLDGEALLQQGLLQTSMSLSTQIQTTCLQVLEVNAIAMRVKHMPCCAKLYTKVYAMNVQDRIAPKDTAITCNGTCRQSCLVMYLCCLCCHLLAGLHLGTTVSCIDL